MNPINDIRRYAERAFDRRARLKLALRRMCLSDGEVTDDARIVLAWLGKKCGARKGLIARQTGGGIDVVGTAVMAGRREIWDDVMNVLNLDENKTRQLLAEEDND